MQISPCAALYTDKYSYRALACSFARSIARLFVHSLPDRSLLLPFGVVSLVVVVRRQLARQKSPPQFFEKNFPLSSERMELCVRRRTRRLQGGEDRILTVASVANNIT